MMRSRSKRRGATLIEAMIALVLLAIGTAAITELLRTVSDANRRMSFQTAALNAFSEFAAQMNDALCEYDPSEPTNAVPAVLDPGLAAANGGWFPNSWQTAPAAPGGSIVTNAGLIGRNQGRERDLHIRYRGTFVAPAADQLPSWDIDVEIREATGDATYDDLAKEDGYWIRQYPLKKVCNRRMEPGNGRGT